MLTSTEKQIYDAKHFIHRSGAALASISQSQSLASAYSDSCYNPIYQSSMIYDTKLMNEYYNNEQILYFTQAGLEKCQVFIVNNIVYRDNLSKYNSETSLDRTNGNGDMIVMDDSGNTFIHPKQRDIVHHSSFLSGNAISFAGLINVEDGNIKNLVIHSGHYNPGSNELYNFQTGSDRNCISLDSPEELIVSTTINKTITDIKQQIWNQRMFFVYPEAGSIIFGGKTLANDLQLKKSHLNDGCIVWLKAGGYPSRNHYYKKIKIRFVA